MKKALIMGDSGLIGKAIIEALQPSFLLYGLSRTNQANQYIAHRAFDVSNTDIRPILEEIAPDIIISCIRGPFEDQLRCHEQIACYAYLHQLKVYFFSTANVFDEDPSRLFYEADPVAAVSDYGILKIRCERLLTETLKDRAVILRLPLVFGHESLRTQQIIKARETGEAIEIYENAMISTVLDAQVAEALKLIIEKDMRGIFHFGPSEAVSQEVFYRQIVEENLLKIDSIAGVDAYYLALGHHRTELDGIFDSNLAVAERIKVICTSGSL